MMKRKWLVVSILVSSVFVTWLLVEKKVGVTELQSVLGLNPASLKASMPKPICGSPVNPAVAAPTDCIPQYLANLPPDPGPAGMKTVDGIDSDKDGVRDDVQRYIALNYGHSETAVRTLTNIARSTQLQVVNGPSLGQEESRKLMPILMNAGTCYSRTATQDMRRAKAMQMVQTEVKNTPERFARASQFNHLLANNLYVVGDETTADVCGFDPATLAN